MTAKAPNIIATLGDPLFLEESIDAFPTVPAPIKERIAMVQGIVRSEEKLLSTIIIAIAIRTNMIIPML